MRKYYSLQLVLAFIISAFTFVSCQEKEDVVVPEETCDTLATVQRAVNGDFQLRLENGEVLLPANVTTTTTTTTTTTAAAAAPEEFVMEGFKVKAGESIIIGYQVTGVANRNGVKSKLAKVNCIVGLKQKTAE